MSRQTICVCICVHLTKISNNERLKIINSDSRTTVKLTRTHRPRRSKEHMREDHSTREDRVTI